MSGILIYAELSREKTPIEVVFELASKAFELSKKLDNCEVKALVITDSTDSISNLESFFDKVFIAKDSRFKDYNTDYYSKIVLDLIKEETPEIVLIAATTQGRDIAPRISATLGVGLTADCTNLDITEDKKLAATRPTFGGKLMATILSKTYPQMATVRAGVFKKNENILKNTLYVDIPLDIDDIPKRVELIEFVKAVKNKAEIENSQIIIAGGRGLKTKENFEKLNILAKKLNASVGASRGAVNLGWALQEMQIGQTGKNVSPKVYVAFGISGAIQHTVGMMNSKYVIAVNNDKNAPIFDIADFGIVADAQMVLNEMLKE